MGRRVWIVIAWLAIITGLAMPAFAQDIELTKSSIAAGTGVYIVDDNSSGFVTTIADQTTDWPFADSVCDFEATFKTSYRQPYHIPLGLMELLSTNVKRGDPFGTTVHWTAQYKPSPDKYFLDNHDMGVQDANLWHNTAKWIPDLSGTGLGTGCYEVWVYIPWNTTAQAPYTVHEANNTETTIKVRQFGINRCTDPRDRWVRLGDANKYWKFNYTSDQWVKLDDQTGETGTNGLNCVVFDAVAFKLYMPITITAYVRCDDNNDKCIDPATEKTAVTSGTVDLYTDPACSGTPVESQAVNGSGSCIFTKIKWGTTYYGKLRNGITPATACTTYKFTVTDCAPGTIYVPAQCTGSITVCKFKDCNMNGNKDGSELGISGWPLKLTGTKTNGTAITPIYAFTGSDGCFTFDKLEKGTYTVTEETGVAPQIQWQKIQNGSDYDLIATWSGGKWLSTNPTGTASGPSVPTIGPISLSAGDNKSYVFGNVPLTPITVTKFLDMNLNGVFNQTCDTYTDPPNTPWWSVDRLFTDNDNDKLFDYPECPIGNWPIKLTGKRVDGKSITITATTNASGVVTFDLPPSDATGYTLAEDLSWVNSGDAQNPIWRATYKDAQINCCVCMPRSIERWQATTPIEQKIALTCGQEGKQFCFGNVCLTEITGTKLMSDDSECQRTYPGANVKIFLMGKDHLGRDIRPSEDNTFVLCNPVTQNPPPPPGHNNAVWYETTCDANGCFEFVDLLPGHYHLAEIPPPGHRVKMDDRVVNGCEMACCPLTNVEICNPTIPPPGQLFQVDAGNSGGTEVIWAGHKPHYGDAITALPGVFAIDPGRNWDNFKRTFGTSIETTNQSITLTKDYDTPFVQCADMFTPVHLTQSGASNIRRWWPLMYEPPTTTWTLTISYLTGTAIQLPGESAASTSHSDTWRWSVTTDIPHMILYLDLLHEVPFGKDEVPLISNEPLYKELRTLLENIQVALDKNDHDTASRLLVDFDDMVGDACIGVSPMYPIPSGGDTGIANTDENPACCKLMIDAEYLGRMRGIWGSN